MFKINNKDTKTTSLLTFGHISHNFQSFCHWISNGKCLRVIFLQSVHKMRCIDTIPVGLNALYSIEKNTKTHSATHSHSVKRRVVIIYSFYLFRHSAKLKCVFNFWTQISARYNLRLCFTRGRSRDISPRIAWSGNFIFYTLLNVTLKWVHMLESVKMSKIRGFLLAKKFFSKLILLLFHLFIMPSINVMTTQPAWDVFEISQSNIHWERRLKDLSGTSQKRRCLCDVFRTSQIHLKKDVFFVTS